MRYFLFLLIFAACGGQDYATHQDLGTPDAKTKPDMGDPDTSTLDVLVPDALPDQALPDVLAPDTMAPDVLAPDVLAPDTMAPDTMAPDVLMPDTIAPDTLPPDSVPPDVLPPDTLAPDLGVIGSIEWITVKAGWFGMGQPTTACPPGTGQAYTVIKKFEMMKYEMTKAQRALLSPPQSWTSCLNALKCPAADTTWEQAAAACNALSDRAGLPRCYDPSANWDSASDLTKCGYRLPTKAEFEYAYRAGTTTEFYNGPATCSGYSIAGDIAWYRLNSDGKTHPIGQKLPNAWGFYDLAGNVAEWVHDNTSVGRIMKGGHYRACSVSVQAAMGLSTGGGPSPYWSPLWTGLRCARSL